MSQYDQAYWDHMDGGNGVQDSVMWQDLAFITHHFFAQDPQSGRDLCGETVHVDLGCGPGYMVLNMRKRGFESFGLDISDYALSIAPEAIRGYLYKFDMEFVNDSHFGREKFDLLTSFETLEHIEPKNADRAIGHIWHLLKPGGTALLNICTKDQPGWDSDPTHVNVVGRQWWQGKLQSRGFHEDFATEAKLKEFHLFAKYYGTFVLRKPA